MFYYFSFLQLDYSKLYKKKDLPDSFYLASDIQTSRINGYQVGSRESIEVILDVIKNKGNVKVGYYQSNKYIEKSITLVPFYSTRYIIFVIFSSFIFIITAILVLLKSKEKKAAVIYHLAAIFTAAIIITTWGYTKDTPDWINIILRTFFHAAYTFVPILFLHFTLVFPLERSIKYSKYLITLYIISGILTLLLSNAFSILLSNPNYQDKYIFLFNLLRNYLIISVIASVINVIRSYKYSVLYEDKKKIKWIVFGLIAGPLSFILLWVLPQLIMNKGLIPEEFVLLLISIVPITFTFSIIKYHAL